MVLMLVAVTLSTAPATPLGVVQSADAQVQKMLKDADPSVDKLAKLADEFIDFAELARRALGKDWERISKAQRDDFSSTMKGVLRASYAQKAVSDRHGNANVEYQGEVVEGNEATVKTRLAVKEDRYPVVYRLFRLSARSDWKIYDVITDEVSLVDTYRDQFRQVIAKKGFDGLLKSLKAKKEQLEKAPDASVRGG